MRSPSLIAVAGPSGGGKTTWIAQQIKNSTQPTVYVSPGLGPISVDLARINYTFPAVQIIAGDRDASWLANVAPEAVVYCELGFHLDLNSAQFGPLPCRRVAVLPPSLKNSEWHGWADEIIPGHDFSPTNLESLPNLWRSPLTGIVFDPPSLEMILVELTGGAYGELQRLKGIFEMPDGRAFYIDFVQGLPGIEYTELPLEPWLEGRPQRFSGIELTGWNLDHQLIADTFLEGCLADEILTHYQQQYKNLNPLEEAIAG
jgi:hypothetical protein